jgi:hypothetical protein
MHNENNEQLFNELEKLTREMNVPALRQKDTGWLLRNAGINNANHPNINKVIEICNALRK